jgi:lipoyl-dependent peroxiredoxin
MTNSKVKAQWNGVIKDGYGSRTFNNYMGPYTFASRVDYDKGDNPEQLIAAAHAGSFSMYLTMLLAQEELKPSNIEATAVVTLDKDQIGPIIVKIDLGCKVSCDGLSEAKLKELALLAITKSPVSRLYEGGTAQMTLTTSNVSVNSLSHHKAIL